MVNASANQGSTQMHIMNMSRSKSAASTISTLLNPIKKRLGLKKSSRGTNALFRAISAENWELVISICESKPYKAERWHNAVGFFDAHRSSKILPLHQACIFHPTVHAVKHIIQAYPMALRSKESGYGRVPLHIACHSNASFECIHELLSHFPAASIDRDLIGRVPLHYALSNGATKEIVEELLDAACQAYGSNANGRREICSVADFNGWLPIHVACFMGASPQVIAVLVKAFPEGVAMATRKNSTPLTLLRGISISPQKRDELESILTQKKKPVKYAARISPARTNIDQVARMSDETCSRGVTLEIDEDETSSLSSMEGTAATVRTGTTKYKTSSTMPRKQLQFGGESRPHDAPPPMQTRLGVGSSLPPIYSPSTLLPTHGAYDESPAVPTSMSAMHQHQIQRNESDHASNGNGNHTPDLMFPRDDGPVLRPVSMMNRFRSRTTSSMSRSSAVSSESSAAKSAPVFQPITSTAAFC
mmetsp:Transcript_26351/g.39048  ORF Transcript_26351/g.39048 Transcript_26351/m.39048 type:complete len:477 (-) Transcript_26351:70-1500(-)